jgi:predicted nucleic acid-binding protein
LLSIGAHDLIIAATAAFLNYTIAAANIQDFV